MVRERLARREAAFLELVTRTVYADPQSPYRRLLELAGCERGDLERLVRAEGVEGALHVLFRQGVYLTIDEFKGRRAARRGSSTIEVDAARLRNPLSAAHVPTQSGGSGGTASPLVYDVASIRDQAANTLLALEAQGGRDWVKAIWGVSTGSAPVVLRFGTFGRPVARWFVHVNPAAPGIHPRYRWIPRRPPARRGHRGRGLPASRGRVPRGPPAGHRPLGGRDAPARRHAASLRVHQSGGPSVRGGPRRRARLRGGAVHRDGRAGHRGSAGRHPGLGRRGRPRLRLRRGRRARELRLPPSDCGRRRALL